MNKTFIKRVQKDPWQRGIISGLSNGVSKSGTIYLKILVNLGRARESFFLFFDYPKGLYRTHHFLKSFGFRKPLPTEVNLLTRRLKRLLGKAVLARIKLMSDEKTTYAVIMDLREVR